MANVAFHPAPGLGDLLPGWFTVPQNPVKDGVSYVPSIGEILPGSFAVPQNPVKDYTNGQVKLIGQSSPPSSSNGCGCGGGSTSNSGGVGDISLELNQLMTDVQSGNVMNALTNDTLFGLPVWGYVALGVVWFMSGQNSHYDRVRRTGRSVRQAVTSY